MPHVVNGIGTWYWGKRSLRQRRDVCPICRRFATLRSYETRLYFVVFFLPIIPLRRYHVTDECGHCRRHFPVPLSEYTTRRTEALARIDELLLLPPLTEAALEAVDLTVRYGTPDDLRELGESLTARHEHDAAVLAHLASAYESVGLPEAEPLYALAVEAGAEPPVRDDHARLLMRLGRPEEAWDYVQEVLASGDLERRGVVSLAVRAFQSLGNHHAAIELLDAVDALGPEWKRATDSAGYRRISLKDAGKGRPVATDLWDYGTAPPAPPRRWWRTPAAAWSALLLLAACGYLGFAAYLGHHRTLHVVNGLGTTYKVTINGIPCTLGPYGRQEIEVPEGEVVIAASNHPSVPAEQRVSLGTPFLSRPFARHTFVVNPDRCAMLTVDEAVYSQPNRASSTVPVPVRTFIGREFYDLESIEDAFTQPPSTVSVDAASGDVVRDVLQQSSISQWYGSAVSSLGDDAARATLATIQRSDPTNRELLALCASVFPSQEFRELLLPAIAARPLNADAHRYWQIATLAIDHTEDLESRYRAILADAPDDSAAMYLLAMVARSKSEARELLARSVAAGSNSLARVGLAQLHASFGEWDKALELARPLVYSEPWPTSADAESVCISALLALDRVPEALSLPRHTQDFGDMALEVACEHAILLVRSGHADDVIGFATAAADEWTSRGVDRETANHWIQTIRAYAAIESGDGEAFARAAAGSDHLWIALHRDLTSLDWNAALKDAEGLDDSHDYTGHMVLYIRAVAARESEIAIECFERIIRTLSDGDPDEQRLKNWLMGETCDGDALANFAPQHARVSLMLATLATRRPELAPLCAARGLPAAAAPWIPTTVAREVLSR